jgi:hypothetical protein
MDEALCRRWMVTEVSAFLAEEKRDALLERASAGLREALASDGPRDTWAPAGLLVEALIAADLVAGRGDYAICWDIGRFIAKREIGPVQAIALKVLRASMIMSLAPGLFSTHFKDAGRVATLPTGDRALVVSFLNFPAPHLALCVGLGGWMEGWLGLRERSSIRIHHVACRCQGSPSCDYAVAWED